MAEQLIEIDPNTAISARISRGDRPNYRSVVLASDDREETIYLEVGPVAYVRDRMDIEYAKETGGLTDNVIRRPGGLKLGEILGRYPALVSGDNLSLLSIDTFRGAFDLGDGLIIGPHFNPTSPGRRAVRQEGSALWVPTDAVIQSGWGIVDSGTRLGRLVNDRRSQYSGGMNG